MSNNKTKKRQVGINKIGIFDPEGINKNPLTGKSYQNLYANKHKLEMEKGVLEPMTYANLAKKWSNFKVYDFRREIVNSIKKNQLTLIKAGTGVGKTVLMPKLALHAMEYKERVITTIPTRLSTKGAAEFAAKTLDVNIGEEVGYYYQGVNKQSDKTKLLYSTPGSLIARLTGNDPNLSDYKVIIIDEAHERSIQIDTLLMLLTTVLKNRDDVRVIIMSATIDLDFFANYFKKDNKELSINKIDVGSATLYPITDIYLNKPVANWQEGTVKILLHILLTTMEGDILVFARSASDGKNICADLAKHIQKYNKSSWILDENKPSKAALESAILSLGVGFCLLNLGCAKVDVRIKNTHAEAFYRRLGMIEVSRTQEDIFFVYPRAAFDKAKAAYMKLLEGNSL